MMFDGLGSSATHIKAGRIIPSRWRATSARPASPTCPPPEAGVPTYQVATWAANGLKARFGGGGRAMRAERRSTPDELKGVWNGLRTDAPNPTAPTGKFVGSEVKRWAGVVKASGAKLD